MILSIEGQLREAEGTPEWDLQKQHGHVELLHRCIDYMQDAEAERYRKIVRLYHERVNAHCGFRVFATMQAEQQ